ncbi:MAG: Ig-like domain-containing protein [Lachnospiraceae bacterium]|nr:Ig-like domain-containing protein [Lachnospiraceae bacterium]
MRNKRIISLILTAVLGITSAAFPQTVFGVEIADGTSYETLEDTSLSENCEEDILEEGALDAGLEDAVTENKGVSAAAGVSAGERRGINVQDTEDINIDNEPDDDWLKPEFTVDGRIVPVFDPANAPNKGHFTYQLSRYDDKGEIERVFYFIRDNIENLKTLRWRQSYFDKSGKYECYIKVEGAEEGYNGKFFSNTIDYVIPSTRLSTPANLKVTDRDGVEWLEWDEVEGSKGYLVDILPDGASEDDNLPFDVDINEFNLSSFAETYGSGKYSIKVLANSGNINEIRCSEPASVTWTPASKMTVTLDKDSLWLATGSSALITPKFANVSDKDDRTLIWMTSDSSVASVDQSGNVTAINAGKAVISVKTGAGIPSTNTCEVTVYEPIKSITLDPESATIGTGDAFTLRADVGAYTPTGTTVTTTGGAVVVSGPAISFEASDSNLTVTNQGGGRALVIAAASIPGDKSTVESQVIVKSTDGGNKQAICKVTIGVKAESIEITAPEGLKILNKGKKLALTAKVTPANAISDRIRWISSDSRIATVDSKGNVTAVSGGDVTIVAYDDFSRKHASYALKVVVPLSKLSLNATNITLHSGKSFTLKPAPVPEDATIEGEAVFSVVSGESSYIKLEGGKITAQALPEGVKKAVVKVGVKVKDVTGAEKEAVCTVNVVSTEVKVSKVTLKPSKADMGIGAVKTIRAAAAPEWADNTELEWSVSEEGKISFTVNPDGSIRVKALSAGTVKLTATAKDGSNKKAVCTIKIGNPVESVKIDKSKLSPYLAVGKSIKLKADVSAASGKPANKSLVWTSSDASIASVDAKGKVTAKGVGIVTITATAEEPDGGFAKYDSCTFSVCVQVKKVALADKADKKPTLMEGNSLEINPVIVTPSEATYKSISWTSSNEEVVVVDTKTTSSGMKLKFSAVAPGTAKLTGITTDGSKKKVVVTVKVLGRMHEEDVKLNIKSSPKGTTVTDNNSKAVKVTGLSAGKKQKFTLTPVLTARAADKRVSFISSDPNVVTVDGKGKVTAVGTGSAVITMTTSDGNYTATCTISTVE